MGGDPGNVKNIVLPWLSSKKDVNTKDLDGVTGRMWAKGPSFHFPLSFTLSMKNLGCAQHLLLLSVK